ncbi:pinin-like [Watersipora subatra]|uniref:pinin-like n=1 Tax=Watersipora subatra TaxID=2589382 RepID=UPI00355BDDF5
MDKPSKSRRKSKSKKKSKPKSNHSSSASTGESIGYNSVAGTLENNRLIETSMSNSGTEISVDASMKDTSGMAASVKNTSGMDASVKDTSGMDVSVKDTSGVDASMKNTSGVDASMIDTSETKSSDQSNSTVSNIGQSKESGVRFNAGLLSLRVKINNKEKTNFIPQTNQSLRWNGQLDDPVNEGRRIELYKVRRRERYMQAAAETYAKQRSSEKLSTNEKIPNIYTSCSSTSIPGHYKINSSVSNVAAIA